MQMAVPSRPGLANKTEANLNVSAFLFLPSVADNVTSFLLLQTTVQAHLRMQWKNDAGAPVSLSVLYLALPLPTPSASPAQTGRDIERKMQQPSSLSKRSKERIVKMCPTFLTVTAKQGCVYELVFSRLFVVISKLPAITAIFYITLSAF